MHAWHDVSWGTDGGEFFNAIVEIPEGSKVKYELDKATGLLRADRVLYSAVHYPANYGFIPQTYCDDGDPLDVLMLCQEPLVPLSIVRCRAIGVIPMTDDRGEDDKIIAAHVDDPQFAHFRDIDELPRHTLSELERFFLDYKVLEKKGSSQNSVKTGVQLEKTPFSAEISGFPNAPGSADRARRAARFLRNPGATFVQSRLTRGLSRMELFPSVFLRVERGWHFCSTWLKGQCLRNSERSHLSNASVDTQTTDLQMLSSNGVWRSPIASTAGALSPQVSYRGYIIAFETVSGGVRVGTINLAQH